MLRKSQWTWYINQVKVTNSCNKQLSFIKFTQIVVLKTFFSFKVLRTKLRRTAANRKPSPPWTRAAELKAWRTFPRTWPRSRCPRRSHRRVRDLRRPRRIGPKRILRKFCLGVTSTFCPTKISIRCICLQTTSTILQGKFA